MKSRITIDLDYDNQPIIKIEYNESDDVRDTMVKRFLETFGGESVWAHFGYSPVGYAGKVATIRPMPTDLMVLQHESGIMTDLINKMYEREKESRRPNTPQQD